MTDIEVSETFGMERDEQDRVWLRVGARRYPAARHTVEQYEVPEDSQFGTIGGRLYRTRQCVLEFETGWKLSVIWGTLTYSSNRDCYVDPDKEVHGRFGFDELSYEKFTETPATVECMAFPPEGFSYELDEWGSGVWDDPFGWATVPEVQALIDSLNTDDPQPIRRD